MPATAIARIARVERHALGPRVFVLGRRVHECHLGVAALIAGGALALAGLSAVPLAALLAAGAWLVAKDWRDLHPATRDTAMWRPGLHRPPDLPPTPVNHRVPLLAACATALVGVVNVASALTPEVPLRLRALLAIAPVHEVALAHALALPAGLALLGAAWQLARRRRRALSVAVALLGVLGGLNLLKGLDVEEAVISWALAARAVARPLAFAVRHSDADLPRALARAAVVLGGAFALALVAVLAAGSGLAPAVPTGAAPGARPGAPGAEHHRRAAPPGRSRGCRWASPCSGSARWSWPRRCSSRPCGPSSSPTASTAAARPRSSAATGRTP